MRITDVMAAAAAMISERRRLPLLTDIRFKAGKPRGHPAMNLTRRNLFAGLAGAVLAALFGKLPASASGGHLIAQAFTVPQEMRYTDLLNCADTSVLRFTVSPELLEDGKFAERFRMYFAQVWKEEVRKIHAEIDYEMLYGTGTGPPLGLIGQDG